MKKQALGRGLGALLGGAVEAAASGERVTRVELDLVRPNAYQPRRRFDPARLEELAASIREGGILQPLIVRRTGDGYELVSGERRLQAARLAGLPTVPVILRDLDDRQMLVLALVENLQREDLNPVDEAEALGRLAEEFGLSHDEVGRVVGKSRTHVTNMLRVRRLPQQVRAFLAEGRLTVGHAKALAGVESEDTLTALADRVVDEGLTVRQTEALASATSTTPANLETVAPSAPRPAAHSLSPHLKKVQRDLTSVLGVPVRILKGKRKGRIEISFSTTDELDTLLGRILGA